MLRITLTTLLTITVFNSNGQHVGIGTTEPKNKLQVHGNLLVTTATTNTNTPPTAAQIKNTLNAATINFAAADSTGRMYDPGGPAGNYSPNQTANAAIAASVDAAGFEVSIESIDLSSADSLIFKESSTGPVLLAVGNLYFTPGKWTFNSPSLYIIFKSNSDANVGAGFSLLFRRLYTTAATQPELNGYVGNALAFDSKNGSLRSGEISNETAGVASVALGRSSFASGEYAVAFGNQNKAIGYSSFATGANSEATGNSAIAMGSLAENYIVGARASGVRSVAIGTSPHASGTYAVAIGHTTKASGQYAMALGVGSTASGYISIALGFATTASGEHSTAMGRVTTASGDFSTAMGYSTTASGNNSTAMGNFVSTNNYAGSFIIGDNSTTTILNNATSNSFRARFDGGYRFFTSAAATNAESCQLPAGGNAWVVASDYRLKEKFQLTDGENFLNKIAAMKLGSWNYISQNSNKQRHYGPMAQDFYAAFGKDDHGIIGNDTTINSADFDGVNLIAIQALEKRTQKIEQLEKDNEALKTMIIQLRKEMDELKKNRK